MRPENRAMSENPITEIERLTARIETLEAGRAHQDRAIDDLSDALAAQWKLIDALNGKVARLEDQLREVQAGQGGGEIADPPPPHY
jgi:SlyX protein